MAESMIQSEQISLRGLIKKYETVVIPILQRDYAQGRKGEEELRTNFLNQLKGFLLSKESFHDLDFVYGNIENHPRRFVPLDGQQRLTTLFLIHYYLSIHDGKYNVFQQDFGRQLQDETFESRFSYETRMSSIAFCNALLNFSIDLTQLAKPDYDKKGNSLRNEITKTLKDLGWFIDSWAYDPTIDSMLRMLDAIHHVFKCEPIGLYDRLVSDDAPAITFRELPMRDNGLNEDLYVKMNSRGLPLTRFEKIKAKIIQELKKSKETRPLSRSSSEKEKDAPIAQYFSHKIDTTWSYMFWPYRTERVIKKKVGNVEDAYTVKEIDSRLLNFIAVVAANYQACRLGSKELDLKLIDTPSKCSWMSFSSLGEEFFSHLIDVFDAFSQAYNSAGIIPYVDITVFDVKELFAGFLKSEYKERVYDLRILFYAYYSFLICHKNSLDKEGLKEEMEDWCRIVYNLTINNRYDSESDFCNAISFVEELLNKSRELGILKLLGSRTEISVKGFDQRQFKEERIKARFILDGGIDWYDAIKEAERNEYLTGQIISTLYLSGLEDEYNRFIKGEEYSIGDVPLDSFKQYTQLFNDLFLKAGLNPLYENDQLFRRALLSKGDYSMSANSNKSLLNNGSRDVSWKRYLHQSPDNLKELKELLVLPISDLPVYLSDIIKNASILDLNDWRGMLVKTPEMWKKLNWYDVQSRRFIRFWGPGGYDCHIYPLKLQRMSGDHYEMRTLYRYYTLKQNAELEKRIEAKSSYSDDYEPFIKLGNGHAQFCVYYNYKKDSPWRIELWNEDEQEIPETRLEKAVTFGYQSIQEESGKVFHAVKTIADSELETELLFIIERNYFCE